MITRTEWQKFTDTVYKTWFTTNTYSKLKNDHMSDFILRFGTDLKHRELETLDKHISIHNNDLLRKRRIQLAADLRTVKLNKKLKERGM